MNSIKKITLILLTLFLTNCKKNENEKSDKIKTKQHSEIKKDINSKIISKNYNSQDFKSFYENFKKEIKKGNKIELSNYIDFPFNEEISKKDFLKEFQINDEIKNIISNCNPEKSDKNYIIDNDSYLITFEIDRNGFWKLKSIYGEE